MNWLYLEGSDQRGPVSDADLDALIQTGKVGNDTYVWREGMAEWLALSQARGPVPASATGAAPLAGQVICAECRRAFAPDQVIRHGNQFICATCKPVFLQKLKEGVAPTGVLNYAGFWIRFCAKFLDGIIIEVVTIPMGFLIGLALGPKNAAIAGIAGFIAGTITGIAYCTFFLGKFGATPGKMATKLRVVNPDGSPITYGKGFARYFGELVSSITIGIGYLMVCWDPEKRALHDRICATRVIRR